MQQIQNKTKISFYGGLNCIGGNKICITSSIGKGVLLDFGRDYHTHKKYFIDFMKLRNSEEIVDAIAIDALPWPIGPLEGIYRKDYTQKMSGRLTQRFNNLREDDLIPDYELNLEASPKIDYVLLSHAHTDHSGDIRYLDPMIKIVCTSLTKTILECYDEMTTSISIFSGIVKSRPKFQKKIEDECDGLLVKNRIDRPDKFSRELLELENNKVYEYPNLGLKIKLLYTDHSMAGSCGFFIEDINSGKKIIYTGDIRKHGPKNQMTLEFIKEAKLFEPDVLIVEGTRVSPKKESNNFPSEEDVFNKISDFISKISKEDINKTIFFNCAQNDLWRISTFYKVARKYDKTLVIDPKSFYLLKKLQDIGQFQDIDLDNVKAYLPRKDWGIYEPWDYKNSKSIKKVFEFSDEECEQIVNDYNKEIKNFSEKEYDKKQKAYMEKLKEWEDAGSIGRKPSKPRKIKEKQYTFSDIKNKVKINIEKSFAIKAIDIHKDQGQYIVYLPDYGINELIDIDPLPESFYIHSKSEPFDDEMELKESKRLNWLNLFDIPNDPEHYIQVHCSGHMAEQDLFKMIRIINPKILFPVHSEYPQRFLEEFKNEFKIILAKNFGEYDA